MKELAYDFRKKLLTVHKKDVRDLSRLPAEDDFVFESGTVICVDPGADVIVRTAAEDFADFLKVSMGVEATVSEGAQNATVSLMLAEAAGIELGEADGKKGFFIEIGASICVYGKDFCGIAQGLYYLEDLMCFAKAPFLKKGEIRKKPMLTPRMVHSGYGMEDYPDGYLAKIAHEGVDAILVYTFGVNETRVGYRDFNDLIARAAKFGIDVYAYSVMRGQVHPEDEGAEEHYESLYGKLFRECPGLAGVTLVGESVFFPSRDPHVSMALKPGDVKADGIPDGLPRPGWYPCEDYPAFLNLVKKIVRKYKPDADIVFWTYNWGYHPEEPRIKLIEQIPTDVALQATFEMFESWKSGDVTVAAADYSLSFAGPGKYFTSEAKAAKKRGIRLYTMSQAGGITWDFGVVPYEPMPYQWMKRFEGMREACQKWGLCGGMETHHHGFNPSIITKLAKHAFLEPMEPMEDILDRILASEYGAENLPVVQEGLKLWSEAITHYVPTEGNVMGAFRVGPAYPFNLFYEARLPSEKGAMFGNLVVAGDYRSDFWDHSKVAAPITESLWNLRIHQEKKSFETMRELMRKGIDMMDAIPNKNEKLEKLINLGRFIAATILTGIHAIEWHLLKCKLNAQYDRESLLETLDKMEDLLAREAENAKSAIPLVEADSRLGWEPSMCYLGDKEHIEWKLRQIQYVLNFELTKLRKGIEL